jgi:hypothetical protein
MALKRRARGGERGAALFIVVLVIVLLGAIGIFAVRVTSLVQVASGYSRRAASAFYLGDFAANAIAGDITGKETQYLQAALNNRNDCRETHGLAALLKPGSIVPCLSLDYDAVKAIVLKTSPNIGSDPQGLLGSLVRPDNPAGQDVDGNFRVELTDLGPGPAPVEGMAQSGGVTSSPWQAAVTVTTRILPKTANACDPAATRASEMQTFRGYVQFSTTGAVVPPGTL